MAYEFRLPDIGEGVVEGEVVRWLVKEGERIVEDQPMVEVMTDKATVDIPSPRGGVVRQILVAAGAICKVGQTMVAIDETNGAEKPTATTPEATSVRSGRALAAPAVRRRARELGIDIGEVNGSGPAGRVMAEDVDSHAARGGREGHGRAETIPGKGPGLGLASSKSSRPAPSARDERVPLRGLRKTIAEKMALSKRTAAHATYVEECDVSELVRLRQQAQQDVGDAKLTFMPFIIKAVVASLREFPMCNAWLDEERSEIVYRRQYNIGVAAATSAGLTVPVIHDADQRSIRELAAEVERLAAASREGKATRQELTGST